MYVLTAVVCRACFRVSKPLLRLTIPSVADLSVRDCSQAGHVRGTLRWDLSPDEIRTMTDSLIGRVKKVCDDVGSLSIENVSVENTLKALANAKLDYASEES